MPRKPRHQTQKRPNPPRMPSPRMPSPPRIMPIHPIMQPIVRAARTRGFTNRIQEYLGTYVPGRVTPNQMATMPQNYYRLDPNIHYDMIRQNFSGESAPLSLPEFKQQLEQLYHTHHLQPRPMTSNEEYSFNDGDIHRQYGPYPLRQVRLQMNLPHTLSTVNTSIRWGVADNQDYTFRLTTVQQIDRFILPRGSMFEDDYDVEENRIRNLGSEELDMLIECIEHGRLPQANIRLGIMYQWDFYDTYAELAQAMGIPELQVANFEAAPFMAFLLSPAARAEFTGVQMVRRNPTRKCRK